MYVTPLFPPVSPLKLNKTINARILIWVCRHFNFLRLSPQRSNKCGICIGKYVLIHPFRQDIVKQTYRIFVFRDYILTLALYTVQYNKADYCLKYFKLVCYLQPQVVCNTFKI